MGGVLDRILLTIYSDRTKAHARVEGNKFLPQSANQFVHVGMSLITEFIT